MAMFCEDLLLYFSNISRGLKTESSYCIVNCYPQVCCKGLLGTFLMVMTYDCQKIGLGHLKNHHMSMKCVIIDFRSIMKLVSLVSPGKFFQ